MSANHRLTCVFVASLAVMAGGCKRDVPPPPGSHKQIS